MSKEKFPYGTTPCSSVLIHNHGQCHDCDFEVNTKNSVGLMAQHAGRTGHECWVETATLVAWNVRKDPIKPLNQTKDD